MKTTVSILLLEILNITTKIQVRFPELYLLLEETPLFLDYQNAEIEIFNYQEYVESLKLQLQEFQKTKFNILDTN